MRKLQARDIVRVIINAGAHSICAFFADDPYAPALEISFSSIVIEDDRIRIEGERDSDLTFASLLKLSDRRWLVDEAIY